MAEKLKAREFFRKDVKENLGDAERHVTVGKNLVLLQMAQHYSKTKKIPPRPKVNNLKNGLISTYRQTLTKSGLEKRKVKEMTAKFRVQLKPIRASTLVELISLVEAHAGGTVRERIETAGYLEKP